jgi:uncharacterized membrane protein (DUF485 family)
MNFFARQDAHRRTSRRLVFLFLLAVLLVVAAVDLVMLAAFGGLGEGANTLGAVIAATLVTLGVITASSVSRSCAM